MADIESVEALLADDEGRRAQAYQDSRGIWSVGIGHNLEANGLPPGICADAPTGLAWQDGVLHFLLVRAGLSDTEIDALFTHDLEQASEDVAYCLSSAAELSVPRYAVMIDMAFNLGRATLSGFTTFLGFMQAGDFVSAAADLQHTEVYRQLPARYARLCSILVSGNWP